MHATERERLILEALRPSGFVSYRDLEAHLGASPATIRRDLSRLEESGRIERVHGGAKLPSKGDADGMGMDMAVSLYVPVLFGRGREDLHRQPHSRHTQRVQKRLFVAGELGIVDLRAARFDQPERALTLNVLNLCSPT